MGQGIKKVYPGSAKPNLFILKGSQGSAKVA